MPGFDIFDTIDQLRSSGEAFCVATVVRTADATSAKAGAKAAITWDGVSSAIWAEPVCSVRCAPRHRKRWPAVRRG